MSVETVFVGIEDILIKPVQTISRLNPRDGLFSTQAIVIYFEDGSKHTLSFHLKNGGNALAMGEVVTSEQVSA